MSARPEKTSHSESYTDTRLAFALEEFLSSLETRGFSPRSVSTRRWFLKEFIAYAAKKSITDARAVTGDFLRGYLTHLKETETTRGKAGYAPSAIGGFSVSIRVFFRFLSKRGLLLFDPARDLPETKRKAVPSNVLSAMEAERVFSLPDVTIAQGIRDRAILELLYSTALRRSELAHLRTADVRMDSGTVFVRQGKGGKDRIIPVGERAMQWLRKYLAEARVQFLPGLAGPNQRELLFFSNRKIPLSPQTVTKIAAKYVRQAGIDKGSCHIFRHTCATEMLSNGADIIHIQEILGHADVQTSQLYTHISPERLREKYNRTHPAAFGLIKEANKRAQTHPTVGRHIHQERKNSRKRVFTVRTDMDRSILAYLEYRKPELSVQSVKTFSGYLSRFADFCFQNQVDRPGKITTPFLEKYQKHLAQRPKRPVRKMITGDVISIRTQKQEMEALCTFVRWCFSRGFTIHDPSGGIEMPRIGTSLVAGILSRAEVEHVIGLPDTRYPYGIRDRVILELLYASGVREGELLNLRLTDADYERDSLRVTAEKHGQDRVIPISARAMKWLYRYVHEARHHFVRDEDPCFLFLSNRGRRITSVYSHCRKYLDLAGIKKDQAVHIFRHSCAAHMIENGADLRTVQEFLGHRSMSSTRIYAHLSIGKLKEVHANTHPAEKRFLARMRKTEDELEQSKKAGGDP